MRRVLLGPSLLLAFAGLAVGLVSVLFMSFIVYVVGALFGAAMAICLEKLRIFDQRQAGWFVALSTITYLLSFVLAAKMEIALGPLPSNPHRDSPTPLLVAGVVGGFLVIGSALWLLRPAVRGTTVLTGATIGAAAGGLLAQAGWALGPSLGLAVSNLSYRLPWFAESPRTLQNYSPVFIVWDTGMGLLLGLIAAQCGTRSRAEEAPPQ